MQDWACSTSTDKSQVSKKWALKSKEDNDQPNIFMINYLLDICSRHLGRKQLSRTPFYSLNLFFLFIQCIFHLLQYMTDFLGTKDYYTAWISLVAHGGILWKNSIGAFIVATGGKWDSFDLTLELLNGVFLLDFLGCTSWSPCEEKFL